MDALRGIAILLVVFFHFMMLLYPSFLIGEYTKNGFLIIENTKSLILNINPFGHGWIGVHLFLAISGFLIHYIYLQNSETFRWKVFFSKRFWRIYPLYFSILLFFAMLIDQDNPQGLMNFFTHLFLVHNLDQRTFFEINPSFWSIAMEIQLYLLYPLFIFLVKKITIKKTVVLIFALTVLICTIQFVLKIETLAFGNFFFLKYWLVWGLGALLADKYFHQKKLFKRPVAMFAVFYVSFIISQLFYVTNYFSFIPVAFLCIAFTDFFLHHDFKEKILYSRNIYNFLTFSGLCSYSLYLIHQPLLKDLLMYLMPAFDNQYFNLIIGLFCSLLILFLISFSLSRLFEIASIKHGEKLRKKGRYFL